MGINLGQLNPNKHPWIAYMQYQCHEKKRNCVIAITGTVGTGKSYSGLSMCYQLNPDFNMNHVVFKGDQFVDLIKSQTLRIGDPILYEEVGIDLDSTQYMTLYNKLIKWVLETFRHRRHILIMTVPRLNFVSKSTRLLLDGVLKTTRVDFENKVCIIKPYIIQYNDEIDKMYKKYLRVYDPASNGYVPVERWLVPKPPEHLIVEYEKRKMEFTQDLYTDIHEQMQSINRNKTAKLHITVQAKCTKCGHITTSRNGSVSQCSRCKNALYLEQIGQTPITSKLPEIMGL